MSVKPTTKEITFKSLGLNPALIKTLDQQGITNPFPIQAATIPDAIAGHDILGRGQTGSGKTLAFGLALLHNIYGMRAKAHQPLALVLAPTRELAQQIDEVLRPLARSVANPSNKRKKYSMPDQGAIAPSYIEIESSGMSSSSSTSSFVPIPVHSGHAPNGELNENDLGSNSSKDISHS